jgi:hypothetical protein
VSLTIGVFDLKEMFMEALENQLLSCFSYRPELIHPLPKQGFRYSSLQELQERSEIPSDDSHSHAKRCLSLIEDPLWRHVCTDVLTIMGPLSVLKIWDSKLGTLSPQDKMIDLYCKSEEISQFVQRYDFIILGSLKQYFPVLKELRVNSKFFAYEGSFSIW